MCKFAVFGNPIKHSLSPNIHTQFAQQTRLEISYDKILAPVDDFSSSAQAFINQGANGFNITVPFKLDAFKFASELTLNAQTAGAVNTIKIKQDKIIGENTDGIGLINDLTRNLGIELKDKIVLILGAGGATQGILLPLLEQRPNRIMIANRTPSKAIKLAKDFAKFGKTCGFGLDKIKHDSVDIIINATSASLDGKIPDIASGIANNAICYDLMYGKQTPFMDWATTNHGSIISDGLGMLVEQAAAAFEFWTGATPNTKQVLSNLRR
ncbi:shikimate dehydrogenase [Candidatus Ruthia endofausta]|uniref:Shikimate dehydrogenase (NADP(+)) n=1 Tax=Candidatus Ruthia endofausta TaxID=2738852 RepID=A0A6N0HNI3_9GAMM|nr:shikimate dehydrogenase [Candidatus Ruthia endofausta]QKQ23922.1 shikimate dehydrogenase [Candidatus Ruthia endofausta]